MLQWIQVNGRNILMYRNGDYFAILKPDKEIRQDDMPEIVKLFNEEYNKYLSTCKN